MNTNSILGLIIAIILIAGGAWYFTQNGGSEIEDYVNTIPLGGTATTTGGVSTSTPSSATSTPGTKATSTPTTVTVNYTASGFSPENITVKAGSKVRFMNQSGKVMWVATDIHPSHSIYAGSTLREHCPDTSGASFDQCATGNDYTFTFAKVGTWKYHNHVNAGDTGVVTVTN